MPNPIWSETDFAAWRAATGLSAARAASILGVTDRTVQRMSSGAVQVRDEVAQRAKRYLTSTRKTKGADGKSMDAIAEQMGLAALCTELPFAHLTGITAAIARGWTSEAIPKIRILSQPERMKTPTRSGKTHLVWYPGHDLDEHIECRVDGAGIPYRIASAERTFVDVLDNEGDVGNVDGMLEIIRGAHVVAAPPDLAVVRKLAVRRGQRTVDNVVDWLKHW